MFAKTLSGEIISLPVSSEDEFKREYIKRYVKEKFRPWVTVDLFWTGEERCMLVNTHPLLPPLQDSIRWEKLSSNPAALDLLGDNLCWSGLSTNPNPRAIQLLKDNQHKIDWYKLSSNPAPEAEELFRMHPDRIEWRDVAMTHPNAYQMLKDTDSVVFYLHFLAGNKHARPEWFEGMEEFLSTMNWEFLSRLPQMMPFLRKNPDKVVLAGLARNPAAIEELRKMPEDTMWPLEIYQNLSPRRSRSD